MLFIFSIVFYLITIINIKKEIKIPEEYKIKCCVEIINSMNDFDCTTTKFSYCLYFKTRYINHCKIKRNLVGIPPFVLNNSNYS